MKTALLAAYVKDEKLLSFAQGLHDLDWSLLASAGTAHFLNSADIPARDVAEIVGPPILGHRVVTLAREIYAALLATDSEVDQAELQRIGIEPISLVYVDFYPLDEELTRPGRTFNSVIEKIDIGGPTLLRAAAKGGRIVVSSPIQFDNVLQYLIRTARDGEGVKQSARDEKHARSFVAELAAAAENRVSEYAATAESFYESVSEGNFVSSH